MIRLTIQYYKTEDQRSPFYEWLDSLSEKDPKAAALIVARLNRMAMGHLGDCSTVGQGVLEARLFMDLVIVYTFPWMGESF
jgi:putative addiction module killer protein